MKKPLKMFLIDRLEENKNGLTVLQLLEYARPVYGSERQCTAKNIDSLMMGLLGAGICQIESLSENIHGELIIRFSLAKK